MTIKLEVGKKYRNRKGEVVEIVSDNGKCGYPFISKCGFSYLKNGRYRPLEEDEIDLIEEVIEPQEPVLKQHKWNKEIIAIAQGKSVQYEANKLDGTTDWVDSGETVNPITCHKFNWRIKPEPKPDVVEFYVKMPFTELQMQGSDFEWVSENGKKCTQLKVIWDGETGELKDAVVIKGEQA